MTTTETTTYTRHCRGCNRDLPFNKFPTVRRGAEYHRNFDLCRACKKDGGNVPAKAAAFIAEATRYGVPFEHTVEDNATLRIDGFMFRSFSRPGTVGDILRDTLYVNVFTRPGRPSRVYANLAPFAKRMRRMTPHEAIRQLSIMGIGSPEWKVLHEEEGRRIERLARELGIDPE